MRRYKKARLAAFDECLRPLPDDPDRDKTARHCFEIGDAKSFSIGRKDKDVRRQETLVNEVGFARALEDDPVLQPQLLDALTQRRSLGAVSNDRVRPILESACIELSERVKRKIDAFSFIE